MQEYIPIVVALANIVTAAGIILLWKQLVLTKKMVSADHERSRRKFALETFREWNRSLKPDTSAARKLIAALNKEQCERIVKYEPVKIEKKHQHLVELCFAQSPLSASFEIHEREIFLKDAAVKQLRYLGVDYLNELEIALSAWLKAVGDKEYIESEFKFLDDDSNGSTLPLFREAFTTGFYPAIRAFLSRDREKDDENVDNSVNSSGSF